MLPRRSVRAALLLAAALCAGAACRRPASSAVVVALPSGPSTWVPWMASEEYTGLVLLNVYEPLVDTSGDLGLRPHLAESWETPDDVTWIFRLRAGVELHDGRPLTAREVAASLTAARDDPASRRKPELAAVESIEARDERTLVLRTRLPFSPLPNRLTELAIAVPASAAGAPPVGTGPYRIQDWNLQGDIVLSAFERYWRGAPAVSSMTFRVIPNLDTRLMQLRDGEVHVLLDVPAERRAEVQAWPSANVAERQGLRVILLGMDSARERSPYVDGGVNPFRDARVRRAVALAVDRQRLARETLGGLATPCDQVVASEVFGYHTHLPRIPHDPAQARRLLAEAGWSQGFGVALDFMPGKYRAIDEVAAAVARDLARVGVQVRPQPADPGLFFDRLARQETSFHLMGWMSSSGDAGITFEYLLHSPGQRYGVTNGSGFSDPRVDRLLEQAASKTDARDRLPLLQAVAEIAHEALPVVPLYRQTDLYGVAEGLELEPRLDRRVRGYDLRWKDGRR